MQKYMGTTIGSRVQGREEKSENGLQSLVAYYQGLFDIEENLNHYSRNAYQAAKRKFVKYFIQNRAILNTSEFVKSPPKLEDSQSMTDDRRAH